MRILLTVSEPAIARNILQTDFWPALLARLPEASFVIAASSDAIDLCPPADDARTQVVPFDARPGAGAPDAVLTMLMRNGVRTETTYWQQMHAREAGETGAAGTRLRQGITRVVGGSPRFKRALRRLYLRSGRDGEAHELLARVAPDVLVALSLTAVRDIQLARAARQRGTPIVGMTRSWDNFTSHGILRVPPDVLLLQNEFLLDVARTVQALEARGVEMRVVGLPHYDWNSSARMVQTRPEFFDASHLDPSRKLILYGAMGDTLFPAEGGLADVFERLVEHGRIPPAQVLFRRHPAFSSPLDRMRTLRHVRPDAGGAAIGGSRWVRMDAGHTRHLVNSIRHADVVVTAASTFAVDACAFDRPVVCVAYDPPGVAVKHWQSVTRFYESATHFLALLEAGGVRVARSDDELAEHINRYLADPAADRAGRQRIVERFIAPYDGKAGLRLGQAVGDACERLAARGRRPA